MVGDGLEDELGGCLLWESVPVREIQVIKKSVLSSRNGNNNV